MTEPNVEPISNANDKNTGEILIEVGLITVKITLIEIKGWTPTKDPHIMVDDRNKDIKRGAPPPTVLTKANR